jgi:hypothetical protein
VVGIVGVGGVDTGAEGVKDVPCVEEIRLATRAVLAMVPCATALTSGAAATVTVPVFVVPW